MSITVRRTSLSNELQRQNIALRMIRDRIQPLRGAINNYVSDTALQGSGFNAHKNYLTQGHLPALSGLSNGITALIEANERHISALNNHLRYEFYCGSQIDGELSRLDSTINSWWFRSYENLGLFTGWTQAQRNRRTTVSLKQLRLQNYQRATGHLYIGLESIMLTIERNLLRIENITVCPQTGEFLLPSLEQIETLLIADMIREATGLTDSEILDLLRALGLAGTPLYCLFVGDPVNTATGNFIYTKEDISVPGRYPLEFKRFYNSIGGLNDVLGTKWTHNYNIRLLSLEEQSVQIIFGDGHMESYSLNEDGSYTSPSESDNVLTKTDTRFELTTQSNEIYSFDRAEGYLKSISDLSSEGGNGLFDTNNTSTEFEYKDGLLSKVKNPCGSLSFVYDSKKHLKKITDHTGREVRYEYIDNLLSKVTHPSGAEYRYDYDKDGNLSKVINPLGTEVITNEYDKHGRMIEQSFADGGVYSLSYDDTITTATEQNGNIIKYERDEKYRTVATIYSDSEERYEYNEQNKRTKHTDRNGNVRKFEYDESGNITKATDPLNNETILEYNECNKPTKITAPNGGTVTNEYDDKGNLTALINPLGYAVKFNNNKQGLVERIELPDSSTNSLTYDDRGNILSIADHDGNETKYEYDELNRPIATIDGNGNRAEFEYNTSGDIIKVTNADGKEQVLEYNTSGKVTKITDFNGGVVTYEYNNMGKPCKMVDAEGNETTLEYDLMWNVSKQTDANGNETTFEYNELNRLETITNAKGAQLSFEYDHNGNRTKVVGTKGEEINLAYDALDRVVEVIEADGAKTSTGYDCMGQVTKVTDAMGYEAKIEYDNTGRKIKEIDPTGREITYTYTALGQVETITDSIGRVTKYDHFLGGLLASITYPDGRSEKYTYDANRNVTSKESQDGYVINYEYDCLDRITTITSNSGQVVLAPKNCTTF